MRRRQDDVSGLIFIFCVDVHMRLTPSPSPPEPDPLTPLCGRHKWMAPKTPVPEPDFTKYFTKIWPPVTNTNKIHSLPPSPHISVNSLQVLLQCLPCLWPSRKNRLPPSAHT